MANAKTICVIRADERFVSDEQNDIFQSVEQAYEDDDSVSHVSGSFHGTPAPQDCCRDVLRITVDDMPKDPQAGFVFGKNAAICDIVLDDNTISDKQFSLVLNFEAGTLLLKNLSRHGTQAKFHRFTETIKLKSTRWLAEFEHAHLLFGDNIKLEVERYSQPQGWNRFCNRLARGVPGLGQLHLSTNIESTNASQRAPVYLQDRPLGEGANARVFKAVEKHTGDAYAMKLYNKNSSRWQEAEILERLRHKYIVDFVRYTKPASQPAELVMELVPGATLQRLLDPASDHPALSLFEARDVLYQVLKAVAYLHSHDIMHRDLKPANIMVQQREPIHIKVIDFSEAKKGKQFSRICGTLLYAAPEISKELWPCNNKVDMFSVGVIALQFFYGLPTQLGEGETWSDAMLRKRSSLLAAAAEDPLALANNFICKLLHENPARRSSAQRSLGHDFFHTDTGLDDANPTAQGDVVEWPTQLYIPTIPPAAAPPSRNTRDSRGSQAEIRYDQAGADIPDTESFGNHAQYSIQQGGIEGDEATSHQVSDPASSSSHRSHVFNRSCAPTRSLDQLEQAAESYGSVQQSGHAGATEGISAPALSRAAPSSRSYLASNPDVPLHNQSTSCLASESQDADSQGESSYYEDCWLDPLHNLGGGSFAENQAASVGRQHVGSAGMAGRAGRQSSVAALASSDSTPVLDDYLELDDTNAVDRGTYRHTQEQEEHRNDGGHSYSANSANAANAASASIPRSRGVMEAGILAFENDGEYAEGVPRVDDDGEDAYYEENDEIDLNEEQNYEGLDLGRDQAGRPGQRLIRRRKRTSAQDKAVLESWYVQNPRPTKADYTRIVEFVSMTKKQAQIWFQNRRQRDRQLERTAGV